MISILDGTVKRSGLEPKMRNPRGSQNTLTRLFIKGGVTSAPNAVLLSYEAASVQMLTAIPGEYGYVELDIDTAVAPNTGVSTAPFEWTLDAAREVTAIVSVAITPNRMQRHVLAIRVDGCDVASSHYLQADDTITLVADLSLASSEVVSVELRAYNPLGCPHSLSVNEATIVVSAR